VEEISSVRFCRCDGEGNDAADSFDFSAVTLSGISAILLGPGDDILISATGET
jgi:hypothetical protein